jgi:hypothetical protein
MGSGAVYCNVPASLASHERKRNGAADRSCQEGGLIGSTPAWGHPHPGPPLKGEGAIEPWRGRSLLAVAAGGGDVVVEEGIEHRLAGQDALAIGLEFAVAAEGEGAGFDLDGGEAVVGAVQQ